MFQLKHFSPKKEEGEEEENKINLIINNKFLNTKFILIIE